MSHKQSVAKDVFVYLLVFIMFYIGVVHFIGLLWEIIGVKFSDATTYSWRDPYNSLRTYIASLIVVWPVFLITSRYIARDLARFPDKANLWVRRWLTYITVFVASITIIVDLVVLINHFLGGELTTRFTLKVLSILVIAGAALAYQFWELRRDPHEGRNALRAMAASSAIIVIIGIFAGFFFIGTPSSARERRIDNERVTHLNTVQSKVLQYWKQTGVLPQSLSEVEDPLRNVKMPTDPETGAPYEYVRLSNLTFKVCAVFDQQTPEWKKDSTRNNHYSEIAGDWVHTAGHECFERTINPAVHKTVTTPVVPAAPTAVIPPSDPVAPVVGE